MQPSFAAHLLIAQASEKDGYRKVAIPPHRLTPLKEQWMKIYTPLVEYMKLQIRFNTRAKCVEIKALNHFNNV